MPFTQIQLDYLAERFRTTEPDYEMAKIYLETPIDALIEQVEKLDPGMFGLEIWAAEETLKLRGVESVE